MENENLRNIENLLAAKASTQPLYEFPVDQLPLGLRDSLSGVAAEDQQVPDHKIYALVCRTDLPIRYSALAALRGLKSEGLLPSFKLSRVSSDS